MRLAKDQRKAIHLKRTTALSFRAIARQIGCDHKTVRAWTSVNTMSERAIEDWLCLQLDRRQIPFQRQVSCAVGIADVVTPTTIYEIKRVLTLSNFKDAVGQVLLYRQALAPYANAMVFCGTSHVTHLTYLAKQLDVRVLSMDTAGSLFEQN